MVTIENVLTIHPYNDLGLLVRDRLIVLAEAQSTWSVNIILCADRSGSVEGEDYDDDIKPGIYQASS